jgi:hypothetical protein
MHYTIGHTLYITAANTVASSALRLNERNSLVALEQPWLQH